MRAGVVDERGPDAEARELVLVRRGSFRLGAGVVDTKEAASCERELLMKGG